jgi:hypothetical protein
MGPERPGNIQRTDGVPVATSSPGERSCHYHYHYYRDNYYYCYYYYYYY